MKNKNLSKAKQNKNDEFYTRYEDIEIELSHYPAKYFKDKIIYLPCDVAIDGNKVPKSNFVKYFQINRVSLGYKKLIATSINNTKNLYILGQDGREFYGYCPEDSEYVSGDYRSAYCQKLFKEADVVVTNPPFTLFRDFLAMLEEHKLQYIIIGNNNAVTYTEIFPLIKSNNLYLGFTKPSKYNQPNGASFNVFTYWYTNINISKYREPLLLVKKYDKTKYPTYLNFNAIDVSNISDIPCDYDGIMGVPNTIFQVYNETQFEIIGIGMGNIGQEIGISANLTDEECKALKIESKDSFRRGKLCYRLKDGSLKIPYARVLIRRKQQEVQ